MRRILVVFALFVLNGGGILSAQKAAADPTHRYFRLICLVHLTGSGKAGDPIVPEYVVQGSAIAQASIAAATATAIASPQKPPTTTPGAAIEATPGTPTQPAAPTTPASGAPIPAPVSAATPPVARPGFLAWSMQKSDDGTMAIVHIVAADPTAFAAILADTRPEIRVFQIGKDSNATIQATMQQYRKDFNLETFEVAVQ